jgi:hypothetical protein
VVVWLLLLLLLLWLLLWLLWLLWLFAVCMVLKLLSALSALSTGWLPLPFMPLPFMPLPFMPLPFMPPSIIFPRNGDGWKIGSGGIPSPFLLDGDIIPAAAGVDRCNRSYPNRFPSGDCESGIPIRGKPNSLVDGLAPVNVE